MGFLSRYRHGRGFGIHSPFAFRFVTECLNERLPYYDYAIVHVKADRTLYRVAVRMQPCHIAAMGGADPAPAVLAVPGASPDTQKEAPDFLVVSGAWDGDMDILAEAIGRECVIYVRGRHKALMDSIKDLMDEAGYGMTFDNCGDAAIAVPRRKLPRQDFDVRF